MKKTAVRTNSFLAQIRTGNYWSVNKEN